MLKRVISGIIFGAIAFAAIWFGDIYLALAIIACSAIAIYEFCGAFRKKGNRPIVPVMAFGMFEMYTAFCYTQNYYSDERVLLMSVGIAVLVITASLVCAVFFNKKFAATDSAITVLGSFYITGLMSFFILLRGIGEAEGINSGRYYLITAAVAVAAADTFALFAGKLFGKRKLIPAVSPHKTVAGSIGAMVGATVFSLGLGILFNCASVETSLAWYDYIVIGIIAGIFSQVGDLSASIIKRHCGIKDFGNLIPGHGGILDRLDSHMMTVPYVFFYIILRTL